jgi:hypothetical protein
MSRRQLLRSMDARELAYWRAYERVEPFLAERLNYHFAALGLIVVSVSGAKRRDGREFELKDLLLEWKSPFTAVEPEVPTMDPAEIERRLNAWIMASNAMMGSERKN